MSCARRSPPTRSRSTARSEPGQGRSTGPVAAATTGGAAAMCEIERHTSARVTAEPAKANHHGAVSPHVCAMTPPRNCPIDEAAEDAHHVHRGDASLQLHRNQTLTHRRRDGAPHERVRPEAEHDDERDHRRRGQREREVHHDLERQADPHQRGEGDVALQPAEAEDADQSAQRDSRPSGRRSPPRSCPDARWRRGPERPTVPPTSR